MSFLQLVILASWLDFCLVEGLIVDLVIHKIEFIDMEINTSVSGYFL